MQALTTRDHLLSALLAFTIGRMAILYLSTTHVSDTIIMLASRTESSTDDMARALSLNKIASTALPMTRIRMLVHSSYGYSEPQYHIPR